MKPVVKQAVKQAESSSDESSDEEEEVPPKTQPAKKEVTKVADTKTKEESSSDEDSSDEEETKGNACYLFVVGGIGRLWPKRMKLMFQVGLLLPCEACMLCNVCWDKLASFTSVAIFALT